MLRLWISKVKKTYCSDQFPPTSHEHTHTHTHTHTLTIGIMKEEQELSAEGGVHYDYVTTSILPTSKDWCPPMAGEEEEHVHYDSVIGDPSPSTSLHSYMKMDTSTLQAQSIYDDVVVPQR